MEYVSTWIKLNVGGRVFQTSKSTLRFCPDSFLARLRSDGGQLPIEKDEFGAILIDRNPDYFSVVLDYLRHGKLVFGANCSLEGIREEAGFYNLADLVELCNEKIAIAERKEKAKNKADLVVMKRQLMELKLKKMSPSSTFLICSKRSTGPTHYEYSDADNLLGSSDFIIRDRKILMKSAGPTNPWTDVSPQTVLNLLTEKGYEIVDSSGSESDEDPDTGKLRSVLFMQKKEPQPQPQPQQRKRPATDERPQHSGAGTSEDMKRPKLEETAGSSEERINEDEVRKLLEKKPLSVKELLNKLKPHGIGQWSKEEKDKVVAKLADILKRINPYQIKEMQNGRNVTLFSLTQTTSSVVHLR